MVVEGFALPLVHTAWITAAVFTVANAVLLRTRIAAEEQALQALSPPTAVTDADVVVAGGGPVGLAVAIGARAAGLRVAVVEPRTTPVDKACGEGLMPAAVAGLARLGVAGRGPAVRRHPLPRGRAGRSPRSSGTVPGLGVRRTALHAALAARAEEVGVVRVPGSVREVEQDAEGVTAAGLRARWLVAADGLHSPVRRQLGLQTPGTGPGRYGLRRHFAVAPWTRHVEVYWGDRAEAYVTPVSRAAGGRRVPRRARRRALRGAAGRLPGAERAAARGRAGDRPAGRRPAAAVGAHAPVPAGCCWSATRRATSTP